MRILAFVVLPLAIVGCAKPARISATLDITRHSPDTVFVMLRVKNLEDRATTPLTPVVVVQTRTGSVWDKPVPEIQPVPFVLSKMEQRDILKVVHTGADLLRATVTIKEQENGRVLINQRLEKAVPAPAVVK